MSIHRNRMIRQMIKDINLPVICHASKSAYYSISSQCKCMTVCAFTRESKPSRDYHDSEPGKDQKSQ